MNPIPVPLSASQAETSAPKMLEQIVRQAERAGASDIHLQMRGKIAEVSFRLDGVITPGPELPAEVAERVFGRIKFLARLKTYQESLPQDGRIGHADLGAKNDLRVATYPTVTGEKIVLRLFNDTAVKSLRELGLGETTGGELETFLRQPSGLLLLTGPAGSGKTSLLRAWADAQGARRRLAIVQVQRDQQDAQQFWLDLLDAVRHAGIKFKDLQTTQRSLEDIFVGLVSRDSGAAR